MAEQLAADSSGTIVVQSTTELALRGRVEVMDEPRDELLPRSALADISTEAVKKASFSSIFVLRYAVRTMAGRQGTFFHPRWSMGEFFDGCGPLTLQSGDHLFGR